MKEFNAAEFAAWVVWYANQRNTRLTPIRIVKFFYLLDLYNAREKAGQTITGWQWKFIHYGPFTVSALNAISAAEKTGLIEGIAYQSRFDKETHLYTYIGEDIPDDYPDIFPIYVCSEIKNAVKLWADDTYGLLSHVYFHTEPMMNALPDQTLDFTCASKPLIDKAITMLPLSKTKTKKARELLNQLKQEQKKAEEKQVITSGPCDDVCRTALQALDEFELPAFSGILKI